MTFRVKINELMDKIGVGYVLGPYQTAPWSCYDADKGITFSAEVRMGSDNDEVEAEAQIMYDSPPAGSPPMEQVCYIRLTPSSDGQWNVITLRISGEPYGEGIYNWEQKCCEFFALLIQSLKRNEIPDVEELMDEAFGGKDRFRDQTGGGGGKSPKIRAGKLLGLNKKGRGF